VGLRWGRGERGGTVFENGFCLLLLFNGGRRKMNSVVQNDTVLAFLFFFFFLYETTSFWIKRAVSFKWAKLQISPLSFLVHFNCIPAKFNLRPHSWPRFSL
jgi:hypothetical protein